MAKRRKKQKPTRTEAERLEPSRGRVDAMRDHLRRMTSLLYPVRGAAASPRGAGAAPSPRGAGLGVSMPTGNAAGPVFEGSTAMVPTDQNQAAQVGRLTRNDEDWSFFNPSDPSFLIRQQILDLLIDPRHEIDRECGYPNDITPLMYHLMYQRDGIAKRVADVFPDETWAMDPVVYEVEDLHKETEFEAAWDELAKSLNVWHWLHRIDRLSGVSRFGLLLLGFDDGKPYDQPVDGLDARGLPVGRKDGKSARAPKRHKLMFLRAFDESACQVLQREIDPKNPRYGQPTRYLLTFRELDITEPAMLGTTAGGMTTSQVHWTRVIHVADNREMSEIYGTPRMKAVWNRICDVRKTMGGSAEMFWKGAFPGLAFEYEPGVGDQEADADELREQMERYSRGLDRYISVGGMKTKTLTPVVADPTGHVTAQMDQIAVSLGIPKRVLFGSEQAQLAASQDAKAWNKRLARRQDKYVGPLIVRPFVDRLVDLGVLPRPKGEVTIYWPDLGSAGAAERADIALKTAQAIAAYVSGQGDILMPPSHFLEMVMDLEPDQVEAVMEAQEEWLRTRSVEWDDERPDEQETKPIPRQSGKSTKAAEAAGANPAELS